MFISSSSVSKLLYIVSVKIIRDFTIQNVLK